MFDEFCTLCSSLAESKQVFRDWSSQIFLVDVKYDSKSLKKMQSIMSGDTNLWKTEPLYANYIENINMLPQDLQTSCGVLYSIVQAISGQDDDKYFNYSHVSPSISPSAVVATTSSSSSVSKSFPSNYQEIGLSDSPSENILSNFVSDSPPSNLQPHSLLPVPDPIVVVEDGDKCGIRKILARKYTLATESGLTSSDRPETGSPRSVSPTFEQRPFTISPTSKKVCLDLISFESTAIFHSQIPRLIGQNGLPLKPMYNRIERSVIESELLTFTELSSSDVHRFNILQICEKMVEKILPKLPNFTGQKIGENFEDISITRRQHFRQISAFTLPQNLSKDLRTDPIVVREYYPYTDQLLLAYVWIPPHRRMKKKEWKPSSYMRVKPTYEEFRILREKEVSYIYIYIYIF